MNLSCKEEHCGFASHDLVAHIEEVHADLVYVTKKGTTLSGLDAYVAKHKITNDEELVSKKGSMKKEKKTEVEAEVGDYFEFLDVKLPKSLATVGTSVPKSIPFYKFTSVAKDVALDILDNKRVMLLGLNGTGKTSLIEQLASRIEQSVVRVNLNGQTTIGDFVGLYTAKAGETIWVDGALPRAMKEGWWLILDEIDFAEPQILAVLNSVLEPGGKLFLKEKGYEAITPHENFRIFATANSIGCMSDYRHLFQGVNIMNEAFIDRWRCYVVNYLTPQEEQEVVLGAYPRLLKAESAVRAITETVALIRQAFEKEELATTFSTRRVLDWADLIIRHKDPLKAAEAAIFSKVNKHDADVIKQIINRKMYKGGAPS